MTNSLDIGDKSFKYLWGWLHKYDLMLLQVFLSLIEQ